MTDLILNVKKKWFDLIKSGKKTCEYREVKSYWTKRLSGKKYNNVIIVWGYPKERNDTNSISFPYYGYKLTSVFPPKIEYDAILHTLNIIEQGFVYAIELRNQPPAPEQP